MEISISTAFYYTKDYREVLDIISSTSCRNIELFLNQGFINVPMPELEREILRRGLRVLSIHTPLEFIAFPRGESEKYWIERSIEISKIFHTGVIVSHMVYNKSSNDNFKDLDRVHKENMIYFKDSLDVFVTTENMPNVKKGSFLENYDELFEFVSKNNLSFTLDTTHCATMGLPIVETFKKFRPYIKNIHLSDLLDEAEHKILGDGNLPIKEFVTELKKSNYEGNLTLEFDFDNRKRNNIESSEQAVEALEKSIKLIKNCM